MNSKIKVLLSVIAMSFVMVGCGGGGGSSTSTPSLDNSTLADGENQYGYFGEKVMFSNTKVVNEWDFYNRENDLHLDVYGRFRSDGDGHISSTINNRRYDIDYGVSKDGKVINIGGEFTASIIFKGILNDWMEINNNGNVTVVDCYDVTFDNRDVVMCPNK